MPLLRPLDILKTPLSDQDERILENGYLSLGGRTCLCGMGGVGKSRLALQLAICTRLGRDFLGWKTNANAHGKNLNWLFLQTENSNRRLQADLQSMFQSLTKEERRHVNAGLQWHTLDIEIESDGRLDLEQLDHLAAVTATIGDSHADVVVFDALRDFSPKSLDSHDVMTGLLDRIDGAVRTGAKTGPGTAGASGSGTDAAGAGAVRRAALVLHDAGTGRAGVAKVSGFDRASFGRNGRVLHAWTHAQINVAPAYEQDDTVLVIGSGKCSTTREFAPFAVRLDPTTMMYQVLESKNFDWSRWRESLRRGVGRPPKVPPTASDLLQIVPRDKPIEKRRLQLLCRRSGINEKDFRMLLEDLIEREALHLRTEPRSGTRPRLSVSRHPLPPSPLEILRKPGLPADHGPMNETEKKAWKQFTQSFAQDPSP